MTEHGQRADSDAWGTDAYAYGNSAPYEGQPNPLVQLPHDGSVPGHLHFPHGEQRDWGAARSRNGDAHKHTNPNPDQQHGWAPPPQGPHQWHDGGASHLPDTSLSANAAPTEEAPADEPQHPYRKSRRAAASTEENREDTATRRNRGRRRRRSDIKKKRRKRAALLITVVALTAVAGNYGWRLYHDRFAPPPDYEGAGSGTVTVTIPKDATGYDIGIELKKAGVVKSVAAFTAAQSRDPDGNRIQVGSYTLRKHMSGQDAVSLMLGSESHDTLVIPEGMRSVQIYALIDSRLGVKGGTSRAVARREWRTLGLPKWASRASDLKDPLEGFLFPATYPISKEMKPQDVLKELIEQSKTEYARLNLESRAQDLGLDNPQQLLTVASLVQAEGKTASDFRKVARVVYNRLNPDNKETYGLLDFDSTVNYLRGKTELATGSVDDLRRIDDPYNTYKIKGLPPGPIGNPGRQALEASIAPANGNWYYFVSVGENETLFAETNEEQNRNRKRYLEKFNKDSE
ncbi:endolytic transglycosylase MltG [Streptomyces sp. NPDC001068]|uniref:endolytic transglycosylase MltG n=1 Tax=Streptomyces sp. NPDC001068 TaxID=3364544 RepID=UPI0036920939